MTNRLSYEMKSSADSGLSLKQSIASIPCLEEMTVSDCICACLDVETNAADVEKKWVQVEKSLAGFRKSTGKCLRRIYELLRSQGKYNECEYKHHTPTTSMQEVAERIPYRHGDRKQGEQLNRKDSLKEDTSTKIYADDRINLEVVPKEESLSSQSQPHSPKGNPTMQITMQDATLKHYQHLENMNDGTRDVMRKNTESFSQLHFLEQQVAAQSQFIELEKVIEDSYSWVNEIKLDFQRLESILCSVCDSEKQNHNDNQDLPEERFRVQSGLVTLSREREFLEMENRQYRSILAHVVRERKAQMHHVLDRINANNRTSSSVLEKLKVLVQFHTTFLRNMLGESQQKSLLGSSNSNLLAYINELESQITSAITALQSCYTKSWEASPSTS